VSVSFSLLYSFHPFTSPRYLQIPTPTLPSTRLAAPLHTAELCPDTSLECHTHTAFNEREHGERQDAGKHRPPLASSFLLQEQRGQVSGGDGGWHTEHGSKWSAVPGPKGSSQAAASTLLQYGVLP